MQIAFFKEVSHLCADSLISSLPNIVSSEELFRHGTSISRYVKLGSSWYFPNKHFLHCSSPSRSDCTQGSG